MEANEDDDMEVDDDQELVIIPVRDKGKDAKLLKAYSTSARWYRWHYYRSWNRSDRGRLPLGLCQQPQR